MPRLKLFSALLALALTVACRSTVAPPAETPVRDMSVDGVWERVGQEIINFDRSVVKVAPAAYTTFRLETKRLDDILSRTPMEFQPVEQPPAVIFLPRPDGSFAKFEVVESPIMEPGLAKRFPTIKNYRGRGVEDRTAFVRFERTRSGFHAMVLSGSGDYFVDRIGKGEGAVYVSYFKKSLPPDPDEFACVFKTPRPYIQDPGPTPSPQPQSPSPTPTPRSVPQATPATWSSGVLRTYRIAVAATDRYVAAIQSLRDPSEPPVDPLEAALVAINRTIDRVNLILEHDVGVRLILINDEPSIIYVDAASDPYDDNGDADDLLELNNDNLKKALGLDKYDIGHLFLVPPKAVGVGAQPCVCSPFYKGYGLSGSPNPTGNAFDVQYVAHEIGHQFGASHSFSGSMEGCKYRNWQTAYEPGSGSTIMGYSSATQICGPETIQSTADPYYHAISLNEIRTFVTQTNDEGGDFCAQKLETGNRYAPQVNAGADFRVPSRTPFALTVASSSDGDGDSLTYTWEEFDRGPRNPPDPPDPNDVQKRPLFRSWPGSTDLTRILPAMNFIMNPPTIYVAEELAANTRTMVFRVTARDGRGLYGFDDTSIRIVSKRTSGALVGPFAVTQPGAGAVWRRGSTQTINWSVANTDSGQINCTRVRILFVVRGDESHPVVLAADVPNVGPNGTASVTLPNDLPLTTMGRIKIEAIGNIFFAVSNADIQIVAP